MKTIEIIRGNYGWKKEPGAPVRLLRTGDTAEVQDDEAKRLTELGVAQIVHTAKAEDNGKAESTKTAKTKATKAKAEETEDEAEA